MAPRSTSINLLLLALVVTILAGKSSAQDWLRIGANLHNPIRIAVPDFKAATADPRTAPLNTAFNQTLWNDLDNSGILEMVSKNFYPQQSPGSPSEINVDAWYGPPVHVSMVAFGTLGVMNDSLMVRGWLFDAANPAAPQLMEKQYQEAATPDSARLIAHRVADEIIFRLGGGISGIAKSLIVFISSRSGHKEVWVMDYDGAGQEQLTHLNSIVLSPRLSADQSRVAFSGLTGGSWQILVYSMDIGRLISFPYFAGDNFTPAWSSDGSQLAFSSSMASGDPEIFTVDAGGGAPRRLTAFKGSNVSPAWNPKTNRQIAWVSGRVGLPQIFIMDADGSNVHQITTEGYAVSPAWSPNGRLLAFSWIRHYGPGGPGAPGGQDIYVMDIVTREFIQLTHDAGRNDFPAWSADGRHLVFQSTRSGSDQLWTMLADGRHQQQLTRSGRNSQPNWSAEATTAAPPKHKAEETRPDRSPSPTVARPVSASEGELFDLKIRDIYFEYDSAELRVDAIALLRQHARIINQHPEWVIGIEGNADEVGSTEYSMAISEERAAAAKRALVDSGVAGDRVRILSYGKEKPVCTESTQDCWQKNRRDHFVLH